MPQANPLPCNRAFEMINFPEVPNFREVVI